MRLATLGFVMAVCVDALFLGPGSADAQAHSHACGKVGGVPIHAHGISCHTARRIYKADMSGKLPSGWICSASLARCYKGSFDSGRYMWWKRTTYRPTRKASDGVVLGGDAFAPNGEGWGTERPATISNGGDLSGLITNVRWTTWGGPIALGWGKNSIFQPTGGYYRHPVTIKLRAKAIGQCEGRRAYLRLSFRSPRHPGGRLGPWRSWSGSSTICSSPY